MGSAAETISPSSWEELERRVEGNGSTENGTEQVSNSISRHPKIK
jgi:hypothetical protein